jgi:hypothetical protein
MGVISLLIAAASALSYSTAYAAITTVTVVGSVADGVDAPGYFGQPDTDLAGDAFSATFSFDLSQPHISNSCCDSDLIVGGYFFGFTTPNNFEVASITIGEKTEMIYSESLSYLQLYNDFNAMVYGGTSELQVEAASTGYGHDSDLFFNVTDSTTDPDFFGIPSLSVDVMANQVFILADDDQTRNSLAEQIDASLSLGTSGTPNFLRADLIPTVFYFQTDYGTSVPEAATWLLMIQGVGAIGAALRRRREATAHTA